MFLEKKLGLLQAPYELETGRQCNVSIVIFLLKKIIYFEITGSGLNLAFSFGFKSVRVLIVELNIGPNHLLP